MLNDSAVMNPVHHHASSCPVAVLVFPRQNVKPTYMSPAKIRIIQFITDCNSVMLFEGCKQSARHQQAHDSRRLLPKVSAKLRIIFLIRELLSGVNASIYSRVLNFLITLAGTPPIRQSPGKERVTTAPAATVTLSPSVTPPRIIAPAPIQQSLPMVTGFAYVLQK